MVWFARHKNDLVQVMSILRIKFLVRLAGSVSSRSWGPEFEPRGRGRVYLIFPFFHELCHSRINSLS